MALLGAAPMMFTPAMRDAYLQAQGTRPVVRSGTALGSQALDAAQAMTPSTGQTGPKPVASDWWGQNTYSGPDPTQTTPAPAPQAQVETGGGPYALSSVSGEGLMRPFTDAFIPPDVEAMRNDPAYQFRLNEGLQGIQRGAAAKGNLLTGGTLKDLTAWSQGLASQEFDKIYGRRLGEYRQAFDIYNQNQANQFNRLSSLAGMGQQANAQQLTAGQNFGQQAGQNMMGGANALAAGQMGSSGAWAGYGQQLGNIGMDIARAYPWGRGGGAAAGASEPYGVSFPSNYGDFRF